MPIAKGVRIDRQGAEMTAISALAYLAAEPERLGRFLALSGLGPETIRTAARDPQFLAGVLDYIAGDEALLVDFAREAAIDPVDIGRAREIMASTRSQRKTP
jgi:hypothetical protein